MLLSACGPGAPAPSGEPAVPEAPADTLEHLVARYGDDYRQLNPWSLPQGPDRRFDSAAGLNLSEQFLADSLALERRYLDAVRALPRAGLAPEAQLTYDMFEREREVAVASFTYPAELLPVNPFRSVPLEFAQAGAGGGAYAVLGEKDYQNWQRRADDFVRWSDEAVANMRDGLRRGYTEPRVLVTETLPVLAALGADTPGSVFYQPLRSLPATLGEAERRRLTEGINAGVKDKILPAYRALHDFLRDEYLPRCRQSVGLSALPLGEAWYEFLIRRETGSTLKPAELHAIGVAETERLRGRLQAVLAESGFAGDPRSFDENVRHNPVTGARTAEELVNDYEQLKMQAASAIPALFTDMPQADLAIRPLPAFREATAPILSYERASAPGSAAVLYVNTAGIAAQPIAPNPAKFLRAALPGRHFQLSIQEHDAALPGFRRLGGDPAFVEGWSIYAESLGEQLGLYRDAESKFAAVEDELQCAAGAVIDTGVHALGWSRDQAIQYLQSQVPIDPAAAGSVVDRVISLPAQALACALGARAFQGLRARAERTLGTAFDLRAFHAELLKGGAMPVDLLASRIDRWLAARPGEAP